MNKQKENYLLPLNFILWVRKHAWWVEKSWEGTEGEEGWPPQTKRSPQRGLP